MEIKVKKLKENAFLPTYGSPAAAGADLYAPAGEAYSIASGETVFVKTGISVEIPEGYAGFVYARSSLGSKRGLAPANKVGVIDSDYRGEIMVALLNHSGERQTVKGGERVAQLVIAPVLHADFVPADELSDTARGAGGFGSTGK